MSIVSDAIKTEDNIKLLKDHIDTLYERVSLLSAYNADTYNESLNKYDGHCVYAEPCVSSQWNIYMGGTLDNKCDITVFADTGGFNQYRQVPATITINGGHIQIDLDTPCSGYAMYKEVFSAPPSTFPTSYGFDSVTLKIDEDYIKKISDIDLNSISIVENPEPECEIKTQPF